MKRRQICLPLPVRLLAFLAAALCVTPVTLMAGGLILRNEAGTISTFYAAIRTFILMMLSGSVASAASILLALYVYFFLPIRWRSAIDTILYCAAGISPVVMAVFALLVWESRGQTYITLVTAVVIYSMPYTIRRMIGALEGVPPLLVESARSLGMSVPKVLFAVLIPGAIREVAATWLFTCARVGAMVPLINLLGRSTYLPTLIVSGATGHIYDAAILFILCVCCFGAGCVLSGGRRNV